MCCVCGVSLSCVSVMCVSVVRCVLGVCCVFWLRVETSELQVHQSINLVCSVGGTAKDKALAQKECNHLLWKARVMLFLHPLTILLSHL